MKPIGLRITFSHLLVNIILFFKNQTIRTNLRASLQNRTTSSPIAHILLHNVPRCLEIRQSIIPPYTLSTPSVKGFVSAMCSITSEKPNEEFATMETLKRRSLVCYGNSLSPPRVTSI